MRSLKLFKLLASLLLVGLVIWGIVLFHGGLFFHRVDLPGGLVFRYDVGLKRWSFALGSALLLLGVLFWADTEARRQYRFFLRYGTVVLPYLLALAAFFFGLWFVPSFHFSLESGGIRLRTWEGEWWLPWSNVVQVELQEEKRRRRSLLVIRGRQRTVIKIPYHIFQLGDRQEVLRLIRRRVPQVKIDSRLLSSSRPKLRGLR